jgi:hypothetical protein
MEAVVKSKFQFDIFMAACEAENQLAWHSLHLAAGLAPN